MTLGLAAIMGVGVVAGVSARKEEKVAKAIDSCLVKGTLASAGSSNWDGVAFGTKVGDQFEAELVRVETTDEFKFFTDGTTWIGYYQLGNDSSKALFVTQDNLKVKEAGYYNFYIQSTVAYVTKVPQEDVEDGYYLRGSVLGWEGAPLKLSGSGPYTTTRTFAAEEKIQMVHYVDGLASYVPAATVTPADATYFNAWKTGNDAQVEHAGKYTVSITAAGAYSFTDEASEWASSFLDAIECHDNGASAATYKGGATWASLGDSYDDLGEIAKNALFGANLEHVATSIIDEAAKRHDVMVEHYSLTPFMSNAAGSSTRMGTNTMLMPVEISNSNAILITVVISSLVLVSVGGFFLLRKKKEN